MKIILRLSVDHHITYVTCNNIICKGIKNVAVKFHPRSYYVYEETIEDLIALFKA